MDHYLSTATPLDLISKENKFLIRDDDDDNKDDGGGGEGDDDDDDDDNGTTDQHRDNFRKVNSNGKSIMAT